MKRNKILFGLTAFFVSVCLMFGFASCSSDDSSGSSGSTENTGGNNSGNGGAGNGNADNNNADSNNENTGDNGNNDNENDTDSDSEETPSLAAPTGLTADALDHETIILTWEAVSGASLYYIYYGTSFSSKEQYGYPTSETEAELRPLNAGTRYYFWVQAADDEGILSSFSKYASATTLSDDGNLIVEPETDNSILSNIRKVDLYYVPSAVLEFPDDKNGIKIRLGWAKTTDLTQPTTLIFYRSTTVPNDMSAFQKIGSRTYTGSGTVYLVDDTAQFSAGNKYYYIVVATDSEDSDMGTYGYVHKWVCGDTSQVCFYYPKKATWYWYFDGADDGSKFNFTTSSKSSGYETITSGSHTLEVSTDNENFTTINPNFYAGCKHKVDLSSGTKTVTIEGIMTGVISKEAVN